MADYAALTADPDDLDAEALAELLRAQQRDAAAQRASLTDTLGRQQGQAGQLRGLNLLTSLGDNPLLRGIQAASGQQGAQMEGNAARTESRLAALGRGGMDPASALLRLRSLGLAEEREANVNTRFDRGLEERSRRASQAARDRKAQERQDALTVPGAEVVPGAKPSAKDAEAVKGVLQSAGRLRGAIGELRGLHQKHGASLAKLSGAAGVNLRQAITGIQLEAKNIAELGALSGPDQGLMEALAGGDPTSIEAAAKSFFGVDSTPAAMDGLERWMNTQVAATLEARGYRALPSAKSPQAPPAPTAEGATGDPRSIKSSVTFTDPKDGKQKTLRTYANGRTTITED
jgi:hypothetical protein